MLKGDSLTPHLKRLPLASESPGSKFSLAAHLKGDTPLWFAFGITFALGCFLANLVAIAVTIGLVRVSGSSPESMAVVALLPYAVYVCFSSWCVWKSRYNSDSPALRWTAQLVGVGAAITLACAAIALVVVGARYVLS